MALGIEFGFLRLWQVQYQSDSRPAHLISSSEEFKTKTQRKSLKLLSNYDIDKKRVPKLAPFFCL
jgi:hypothetical protein